MSFVSSLLQAIVRLDGEAVVLHVGEKPYIVTPTDQVDLATKGLTIEAATGILNQLLPPEPHCELTQTPSEHTFPEGHVMPTQRVSTQLLLMQT